MGRPYPGTVIKLGSSGDDVYYIKNCLFDLGYYDDSIKVIVSKKFGEDSVTATKKYQSSNKDCNGNKLVVDGKIGKLTWNAIVRDYDNIQPVPKTEYLTAKEYPNLTLTTINTLNEDWNRQFNGVYTDAVKFMRLCLKQAYDTVNGTYKAGDHLVGMYILGANLYNKNGVIFTPTAKYIEQRAKARPTYFNGGRKEFMLKELKYNPNINASDCSGMIIGVGWKTGLYKGGDTTADSLSSSSSYSTAVSKSAMLPGAWVAKSGHIGVYLGAGFVVEFAGGAYGCQITDLNNRKCRNMMTGKLEKMSSWTKYRKPKWY